MDCAEVRNDALQISYWFNTCVELQLDWDSPGCTDLGNNRYSEKWANNKVVGTQAERNSCWRHCIKQGVYLTSLKIDCPASAGRSSFPRRFGC